MFWSLRRLATKMADFESGRLRGFCVSYDTPYCEQDIIDMKGTGANVMRVPVHWYGDVLPDLTAARQLLKWGAAHEVRVIVVLCPIDQDYWTDPAVQQSLIDVWSWMAGELRWFPALQAYDIINEPLGQRTDREQKTQWLAIAQCIATAIRAVDSRTPIMVEPCWWGLPGSFWQTRPVRVSGLVASFHYYEPHEYTCQGITGRPAPVALPPDDVMERVVEARKFADEHRVPMFVGEFSAVQSAPDRAEWLRRAATVWSEQGWGWTYHVWRGWSGWSADGAALEVLRDAMRYRVPS